MADLVQIGDAYLYHGDCRDVSLDYKPELCVTDAPYRLTTGGVSKSSKTMSGIFAAHNYANDGQLVMVTVEWREVMSVLHGALADDADCYVMANDKNVNPAINAAEAAGFGLHNILAWDKVTPTANRWYMKNLEFTLYLWKGKARTINSPSSKQSIQGPQRDVSDHPTEKPVWLMDHYICNSSKPGEVVFDPFMGSGTTGVAAIQAGRQFVGIEIDRHHFETACQRIREAYEQPTLFGGAR